MPDNYVRPVTVLDVVDGDTFRCRVDLGFYVTVTMLCRLAGINAPEHDEPGGPEARAALVELLGRGRVSVQSVSVDKYAGRFDAYVMIAAPRGGAWIAGSELVDAGLAVRWDGRGPKPRVPWPPQEANTP